MVSEAMVKYEKAVSMRSAAQEMVDMTEQGYERKTHRCDMAWKEMLHHSTIKVQLLLHSSYPCKKRVCMGSV